MAQPGLSESMAAKDRIYKLFSILSMCFVIGAIIILWNNPILHYELSPYSGIPAIAWVLLFVSFFLAGYVLVSSQMDKTGSADRWFLIGLVMVILVATVVLLFPYIRGAWFTEKADALSHVSLVATLLTVHHTDIYYPALHLLGASLVMIADISPYDAISFLGILIYLLSIVWVYCLARVVLKDRSMIALAVIAAATFPPGRIATLPYYLSIMILPLVMAVYFSRHKSMSHAITCLILLSLMVLFHPLTGLILMFCLIGMELFQHFRGALVSRGIAEQPVTIGGGYSAAMLFLVGFLMWMTYKHLTFFAGNVGRLIEAITGPIQLTMHQHHLLAFPTLGIEGWEFMSLFLRMYGANIIFLALTLIAIILICKRTYFGTALEYEHRLFSLSAFMVVTGLVMLIALVRPGGVIFSVPRLTFILTVMTPIFGAYALYHICTHLKDKIIQRFRVVNEKVKESLLLLPLPILTIAFIMMAFMIYPSTYVKQSNLQLMKAEIAGATWLLEHTSLEEKIEAYDLGINMRIVEVSATLAGYYPAGYYPGTEHPYLYFRKLTKRLPDHMGYDSYDTMGEYFGSIQLPTAAGFELLDDGYVTLTRERTMRALGLYAPLGWLNQSDLERFYSDKTVNQVYSNYEYSAFWVPPTRE